MEKILLLTTAIALGGCTLFGEPIAEKVADVVDRYCEEPYSQRLVYRETVNAELAGEGHSIDVTCNGDPED